MAKPERKAKDPTRKQVALNRRERELQRRVLIGIGIVAALIVVVLAIGVTQQYVLEPNSPVATVNGSTIRTSDYQKRVKYERSQLQNQLLQYQQFQQQFDPDGTNNFFGQQIQQLQQQLSNQETLALRVLDTMIDETLVAQEAVTRSLTVDPAVLQKEIQKSFGYEPDATPTPVQTPATITNTQVITNSSGVTQTQVVSATVTPLPTPTPFTEDAFKKLYNDTLTNISNNSGLSEAEFRQLTERRLLQEKLQEIVSSDVITTEEQVHARHILVKVAETATDADKKKAEEKINAALARLKKGEAFDVVAKEVSEDTSASQGGDLGWFGRGRMVKEFEDAAFNLEVNQISEVIKSQFGYHIIQVTEKDPKRPLSDSELTSKKQQAFDDFLKKLRESAKIERFWNTSKVPPTPYPTSS